MHALTKQPVEASGKGEVRKDSNILTGPVCEAVAVGKLVLCKLTLYLFSSTVAIDIQNKL